MFNLEEELKNLPEAPGVYIMHNKNDEIIYVGKAKVLKKRVRQYFQKNKNHTPKVLAMVANIAYFEYIVTDSEIEALVLECNLIKKHRPKYNILLKDDKQYPYIKVTINKDYPRIFMSRNLDNDGAKYFGPYTGMQTVRTTLEIVQKIFKPPTCNRRFPGDIGKGRPCLNYHINNCFAPCIAGNVSKEAYRQVFFEICSFLEGNHEKLLETMQKDMLDASKKTEFEKAAALRDKINAIRLFEQKQKIVNTGKQTDMDIAALARLGNKAFVEMFFIRAGRITGHQNYKMDDAGDTDPADIMSDFIKQFYSDTVVIPQEILTEYKISDIEIIEKWLSKKREKKVKISSPQKGERKELMRMVHKNAEVAAENYRINNLKISASKNKISEELAKKLGLESIPERIESYDISNISGSDNVASMVVFVNGKPSKKDYRKFHIKSFEGADDYRAMQEVIYRRFRHALDETEQIKNGTIKKEDAKFLPLPDLLLIDGGKGHLAAVNEILDAIECDIPAFGMVKDNKHRTRGLIAKKGEIELSAIDNVFTFITQVQDEVHRSAITFHRNRRSKGLTKSVLDNIPGVGNVKKAKLMSHFKSISQIKSTSLNELASVIDKRTAQNIIEYFKENKNVSTDSTRKS